jgi:prephenate dehydratase
MQRDRERPAMTYQVRRAEYFYTTVRDEPGEALKLLTLLAERGINLLALPLFRSDRTALNSRSCRTTPPRR